MVIVNYLANALPINGLTTGQVSAKYENLFTPAGYAFSIWALIYILLLGFSLRLLFQKEKVVEKGVVIGFIATCLLNSMWVLAWHHLQVAFSLLIMVGLLATLTYIVSILKYSQSILSKVSFGIYLGWICVATIANVTILLISLNWDGWGISPVSWTIIMIAAGTMIGSIAKFRFSNLFVILPVAWAFFAIYSRRSEDYPVIAITALVGIAVLSVSIVFYWRRLRGGIR